MKKRIRITFRTYPGLKYGSGYRSVKSMPFPIDFYNLDRWRRNLGRTGWINMSKFLFDQIVGGENGKKFIHSYSMMRCEEKYKYKILKTRELMVYEKIY